MRYATCRGTPATDPGFAEMSSINPSSSCRSAGRSLESVRSRPHRVGRAGLAVSSAPIRFGHLYSSPEFAHSCNRCRLIGDHRRKPAHAGTLGSYRQRLAEASREPGHRTSAGIRSRQSSAAATFQSGCHLLSTAMKCAGRGVRPYDSDCEVADRAPQCCIERFATGAPLRYRRASDLSSSQNSRRCWSRRSADPAKRLSDRCRGDVIRWSMEVRIRQTSDARGTSVARWLSTVPAPVSRTTRQLADGTAEKRNPLRIQRLVLASIARSPRNTAPL